MVTNTTSAAAAASSFVVPVTAAVPSVPIARSALADPRSAERDPIATS
jgi:hypothetical protein